MSNGINFHRPDFLHSISSASRAPADAAGHVASGLSNLSYSAHKFSQMIHKYTSPGELYNSYVRPGVYKAMRPLTDLQNAGHHATFKLNQALTSPIRHAHHAVTDPIHHAHQAVNKAFGKLDRAVSHPFETAINAISSPGRQADRLLSHSFGHVFSRIGNLEHHVTSALRGRIF